tara:strand:+ start:492 stop:614 length:123 start_codon:yes stop_codon:yes gene_type:complete
MFQGCDIYATGMKNNSKSTTKQINHHPYHPILRGEEEKKR